MRRSNKISLMISGVAAIILLAVLLLWHNRLLSPGLWLVITVPVAVLAGGFFLVKHTLNVFIREKVNTLHRTIHNLNPQPAPQNGSGNGDIISEVEEEVMDWAEQKKTELEKLKGMETYRKEFLGNVSHELKTPIFNIQGYVLTLLEVGVDDPEITKLYLERAVKNINRMTSIVDDLESISGLESSVLKLNIESFNIRKMIKEVFESNEMRAKKYNIKLETGKTKESGELVKGDKRWIFRVLNNLIVNSINYGEKNGKTTVSYRPDDDKVYVEIRDNGIGISADDLHRVFERFYRVDKSRSRDTGGTGLGLSIVKHVLEAHNQTVDLKSVPGKGTTFTFSLDKA